MKKHYYQKIEEKWSTIVNLYTKDNWSTHKIARVLFGNEQEYFWRIHRVLRKNKITKDVKDKMLYVRKFNPRLKKK